jgi:hypothetical protein
MSVLQKKYSEEKERPIISKIELERKPLWWFCLGVKLDLCQVKSSQVKSSQVK